MSKVKGICSGPGFLTADTWHMRHEIFLAAERSPQNPTGPIDQPTVKETEIGISHPFCPSNLEEREGIKTRLFGALQI